MMGLQKANPEMLTRASVNLTMTEFVKKLCFFLGKQFLHFIPKEFARIQCLFMLKKAMHVLIFVIFIPYIYSFCDSSLYLFVKQMCQIGNTEGFVLVENYTCVVA